MWVIPPKASTEFVADMEEVLEVYQRPYETKRPVVCLDETFTHLSGTALPGPGAATRPRGKRTGNSRRPTGKSNLVSFTPPSTGDRVLVHLQFHTQSLTAVVPYRL